MANFQTAIAKAKRLTPQKVNNDLFNFIRTLERELALYNRAALNLDSEDVSGNPIGFYSEATEAITEGRKRAGQPFSLFETGVFLPSIFAKVESDSIFFGATDPKLPQIFENLLSKDIFGLRDSDLNKVLSEKVTPYLLSYFKKELI